MNAKTDGVKIPERVLVQLVDSENKPVHLEGVVLEVHLFATRKNDFQLAPFVSNLGGTVTMGAAQMNALVLSEYDSGLMDHVTVEMCSTRIEIRLWSEIQVNRALEAREKVWQSLLKGESDIWNSIEDLKNIYRTATNSRLEVPNEGSALADRWDGRRPEYEYRFPVKLKA